MLRPFMINLSTDVLFFFVLWKTSLNMWILLIFFLLLLNYYHVLLNYYLIPAVHTKCTLDRKRRKNCCAYRIWKMQWIFKGHLAIHCSNRSFIMDSQFIFSNSVIWDLLFKFRQKRMHLFWSICDFDFNLLFRLGYQAEHA